LIYVDGDGRGK